MQRFCRVPALLPSAQAAAALASGGKDKDKKGGKGAGDAAAAAAAAAGEDAYPLAVDFVTKPEQVGWEQVVCVCYGLLQRSSCGGQVVM